MPESLVIDRGGTAGRTERPGFPEGVPDEVLPVVVIKNGFGGRFFFVE